MGSFENFFNGIRYGIVPPKKKDAAECRLEARNALRGRWGLAVGAGLLALLLGGVGDSGSFSFNFDTSSIDIEDATIEIGNEFLVAFSAIFALAALSAILISILVSGVVRVGYEKFNLDLLQGKGKIETLFDFFKNGHYKSTVLLALRHTLVMFLYALPLSFVFGLFFGMAFASAIAAEGDLVFAATGLLAGSTFTLLLLIPAALLMIVGAYRYSMSFRIYAENPNLTAREAMDASAAMMKGHKWELFCLNFSFIGWYFLAALTFGVGMIWVIPYSQAACASFYRNVSLRYKHGYAD